jgi:hypothetical protein
MVADLQHQIDALELRLRALIREYPEEAAFWPEFAQAASEAEARVFAEHLPTFQDAMVSLLRRLGKLGPSSPVSRPPVDPVSEEPQWMP